MRMQLRPPLVRERHSRFSSSRPLEREGDRTTSVLGKATDTTWCSPPAGSQGYSEGSSRVLSGYSAGTQLVLEGGRSRWHGCAGRRRRRWCVVGISVNIFPCTSIETDTDAVTRVGLKRYIYSDTRGLVAGVRGTGQHCSSVWRWSARGLGPRSAQLQPARDPVRRKHAAGTPRVPGEYAASTP